MQCGREQEGREHCGEDSKENVKHENADKRPGSRSSNSEAEDHYTEAETAGRDLRKVERSREQGRLAGCGRRSRRKTVVITKVVLDSTLIDPQPYALLDTSLLRDHKGKRQHGRKHPRASQP